MRQTLRASGSASRSRIGSTTFMKRSALRMNTPPSAMTSGLRMSIVKASIVASFSADSRNTSVQSGSPARTRANISLAVRSSPLRIFARRAIPAPEQNPSALPSLLYPNGPAGARRMCPISPALSLVPEYSLPSITMPAPSPVPNVMNTMFLVPRPAPKRYSARAHAFASFCRCTGTLKRSEKKSTIRTSSQPGRFGGDMMTPARESRGPPQLMPMAETSRSPPDFEIASMRLANSSRTCRQESPAVGNSSRESILIESAAHSPVEIAHLVPPMSSPADIFKTVPPPALRKAHGRRADAVPAPCKSPSQARGSSRRILRTASTPALR